MCLDISKQECKVFIGGLSWETTGEKLRAYFENFGAVREAFVSYNRSNGKPRGFGFVIFNSHEVADKVVASKHTIDRREVEAKRAVPKDDSAAAETDGSAKGAAAQKSRKIFVGGLAPGVDDARLRQYFEEFGEVEDAVVMYDHDNKKPRCFGFVSYAQEASVEKVFSVGVIHSIMDKQIEIKPAVPRDQMPATPNGMPQGGFHHHQTPNMQQYRSMQPNGAPYGAPPRPFAYPPHAAMGAGGGQYNRFRPPTYPTAYPQYMPPHPPAVSMSRPSASSQPHFPQQQQYSSSTHQQYSSSPVGSLPSNNGLRHPQHPSSTAPSSNASSFTAGGTAGHATALHAAQHEQDEAAAAAANGYRELYALSNSGAGVALFPTSAQAAALFSIANGAFPNHLNGMPTGAAEISGPITSLGQQGLQNLKALAAGYSSYGGGSQRGGSGYADDELTYGGSTEADVFAEQISTRMAGLAVSGGEYGSPFTAANTIGSGWSH